MTGYRSALRVMTGRRRGVAGAAGAVLAAAALPGAGVAAAAGDPLPAPKPIPCGFQIPNGPLLHVLAPGPVLPFTGVTLEGLDVENSVLTDFQGASALAFLVGSATGHDGTRYNLETDLRVAGVRGGVRRRERQAPARHLRPGLN
jgi:hypothetical protein